MGRKRVILLPRDRKILNELGENIKLSRLRRKLSAQQVADRAGVARTTVYYVEKGSQGVSIGYYLKVLVALGLAEDLTKVAKDDLLGRKLQDAELSVPKRAPKNDSE